jgi:transposase-like protein
LASFSGYLAADEVYDGPFCVLVIVDNRTFQRLAYRVLEHDPAQQDVRKFFSRLKVHLDARGLKVLGITTDGSSLYPEVIQEVFPGARHQICQFHVLKEIIKAVLHAVAKIRKELKAKQPALPRGRPSRANQAQARKAKRIQQRIADLFDDRHLFVQHHLTPVEKRTLQRITRGLPHLRTLRQIMDEVYRLFDRRCRTETALANLARLRRRVRRFKRVGRTLSKLFTPNLEKALTFLDDRLLPATSNAVERSNRRFRKAQRSVYSVRTAEHIRQRIALDMERDQRAPHRIATVRTLHLARSENKSRNNDATVSIFSVIIHDHNDILTLLHGGLLGAPRHSRKPLSAFIRASILDLTGDRLCSCHLRGCHNLRPDPHILRGDEADANRGRPDRRQAFRTSGVQRPPEVKGDA